MKHVSKIIPQQIINEYILTIEEAKLVHAILGAMSQRDVKDLLRQNEYDGNLEQAAAAQDKLWNDLEDVLPKK